VRGTWLNKVSAWVRAVL